MENCTSLSTTSPKLMNLKSYFFPLVLHNYTVPRFYVHFYRVIFCLVKSLKHCFLACVISFWPIFKKATGAERHSLTSSTVSHSTVFLRTWIMNLPSEYLQAKLRTSADPENFYCLYLFVRYQFDLQAKVSLWFTNWAFPTIDSCLSTFYFIMWQCDDKYEQWVYRYVAWF